MCCGVRRLIGMDKNHTLAALKLLEDRLQAAVSQVHPPGISKDNKTIESENVDCVSQLLQRGIDVRQRHTSEACEPVGSSVNEVSREFVATPRQGPSLRAVAKVHARRAHRQHGNVNPCVIHE